MKYRAYIGLTVSYFLFYVKYFLLFDKLVPHRAHYVGEQGTTGNTLITWLTEEAIICGNVMF